MKKRILFAAKFYYNRGGAEVVVLNTIEELQRKGYATGVFTMDYPENTPGENYYTAPRVDFSAGLSSKMRFARRTLGGAGVKSAFKAALDEYKPEIVHLHNIHSYLSPAIAKLAKHYGCKVVWTLHDLKLVCPAYLCMNANGICEECFRNKFGVLKHRCVKGGFAPSALALLEFLKWNRKSLEKWVDEFVCPSRFMKSQLLKAGFSESKLKVVCNFINRERLEQMPVVKNNRGDYYVYVGRMSQEKGIETLLAAAARLPYRLKLAGGGPLLDELRSKYADCGNIEFLGKLSPAEVCRVLADARFTVLPSECYENNPLSLIESLCAGTPVVGANIGGIPELISPSTGTLFESGNQEDLKRAIEESWSTAYNYETIAKESKERFSFENHYLKLKEIYG